MPLNIAMVVASPFPANHGTPGSIREMAEALARCGHRLHVVTYHFGEGPMPKDVRIHRIADLGFNRQVVVGPTWEKPLMDGLMVPTLCRVIKREGIDVIHAHNYEGALIGALASLITGRPLVYNAVNTMSDELPSYNFIKPRWLATQLARGLDYWVPRTAKRIIAISEELAGFLRSQGIASEHIRVVPLGIDTTLFQRTDGAVMRQRYGLGTRPLVMYTGILDHLQRVDYLLHAMRHVVAQMPQAKLLLVTNIAKTEDVAECQRLIADLGLREHVDIVTHDTFEDIPLFLAAADVAVVCRPHCPGFPVKLLNYMAAGKPIVTSEGSAKGLQHLQQAWVVADHDWQGLGDGILQLLQDTRLAKRLGENARQWVNDRLAWSALVADIEAVYDEVLKQSPRALEDPPAPLAL
jgi:glycosyltransferase involved in cell wall biosynthesis